MSNDLQQTKNIGNTTSNKNDSETKNSFKFSIDQEICIKCGSCHIVYPQYFMQNEKADSIPIEEKIVDEVEGNEIKMICPVEAIDIEEVK